IYSMPDSQNLSTAPTPPVPLARGSQQTPPLVHPKLSSELKSMELTVEGAPDQDGWERLLGTVDRHYRESEKLSRELVDAMRGWSSFENLFRISPIPIMEQDYTRLEDWMQQLRDQGVTNLRDHVGDDIESIRSIVPMIRIVAANPAAVTAVGVPLEDLIGPIDPQIVNEGSESGWLTQLEAVWSRQPEVHADYTAATAGGMGYDAKSILAAPLIDGKPDFSRAVFTLIDVTDQRNEERRMQELMEAKNRFLASVSHEIRTPLTAILGFARVLDEDRTLTDDDRRLMVSSIVQHSQEVADLVEDLLVAARADMGQVEVLRTRFDVVDQIRQTLEAGGSFTADVGFEFETSPIRVMGDPARTRQIVRNLLTNAERYGGSAVVARVTRSSHLVAIEVTDDGPGIPREQWDRIFEPYRRGHDHGGQPGSVGIGLAISRSLAERMGGALVYDYEAGLSRFRLELESAD
ncbi:MAG: PAS domain-containing sensor histidine kinase, partial [Acidimicrobiia bacterium]